jgi:hypothetical protein
MLKRAEVSGEEVDAEADESVTTTLEGTDAADSVVDDSTTETLLGLGSFLSCLGATSETVEVTAGDSTEAAVEEVLDVLTILFDYTHISSVFLSSFQYILYITKIQLNNIIITW